MRIGVPRQTESKERRVAVTPAGAAKLAADGHQVNVEVGAGLKAGFSDREYREAGAVVDQRTSVIGTEGVILQTVAPSVYDLSMSEWFQLGPAHTYVALLDPLWNFERAEALLQTGAAVVSLELIPRITRAQSMDVLSSMGTVSGYQAVLLAASRVPRMFPMLMTAGGTIPAAKVVVLGAGVAGLQAIATAKRLGAIVQGYDIRPAAVEQIASVGAKPIMLELDFEEAEDEGGYAREQAADVNRRQNEALLPYVADADVVITTAAIPGAASPELITTEMVEAMRPGSVVVDLAAERGGNCRMTKPDDEVNHGGVIILGPTDLPSRAAASASLMFSNNIVTLLRHLAPEGELQWDLNDEITAGTLIGWDREVMHPRIRQLLELPPVEAPPDGGGDQDPDPEAGTGPDATIDRAGSDGDGAEDRGDDDRADGNRVVQPHVDDGASGEDGADNGEDPGHQRPHPEREQS